jgi:hypothetical protein
MKCRIAAGFIGTDPGPHPMSTCNGIDSRRHGPPQLDRRSSGPPIRTRAATGGPGTPLNQGRIEEVGPSTRSAARARDVGKRRHDVWHRPIASAQMQNIPDGYMFDMNLGCYRRHCNIARRIRAAVLAAADCAGMTTNPRPISREQQQMKRGRSAVPRHRSGQSC